MAAQWMAGVILLGGQGDTHFGCLYCFYLQYTLHSLRFDILKIVSALSMQRLSSCYYKQYCTATICIVLTLYYALCHLDIA